MPSRWMRSSLVSLISTWCGGRLPRGLPWQWVLAGLSTAATDLSTWTWVIVSADSLKGDWNYLRMYAGAILCGFSIVVVLLPAFYASPVRTVLEGRGDAVRSPG